MDAMTVAVTLKAKDNISPVVSKVNASLGRFEAKAKSIRNTSAKVAAVSTASLTAFSASIGGVVNKYQDLAKAKGEIKSLGLGAAEIKAITTEAKAFSNMFAGTTQADFVRASYDIKSGISSLSGEGVAKFTSLAALTAKATKSTTDQMTSFFATGYGIYAKQFDAMSAKSIEGWNKLSQEEKDIKFGEYFAAGIAGAVKEFKTTGGQMQAAIENLGATATTSNVPLSEQLAILGLLQRSMSGSEAATKYRAFLNAAAGAQKKLNLQFLDANNRLKSTPEILDIIKKKYGDTLDDMEKQELKKAFGTDEALAYIMALINDTDKLRDSQKRLHQTMKSGTKDVLTMAQAMNEGREFELLAQRAGNLASTIGAKFAPMAIAVAAYIGDITTSIEKWMNANDGAVDIIVSVITAGGGLLATVSALSIGVSVLSFAAGGIVKPLRLAVSLFGLFSKKGNAAAGAVKAVSTGMDAIAGKSVMARLGVQVPKKASLLAKFKNVISVLRNFAIANPIMIAAVVTAGAVGAMASAQHTQIMDKRSTGKTPEALKTQIARMDARLSAMKGQGDLADRAKEFLLNGNATDAEIKDMEKQIALVKRRLAVKTTSTTMSAAKNVRQFSEEELQRARENAYKARDARKLEVRNNTTVSPTINITVNAVKGEVDANQIGRTVSKHIEASSKKIGSVSFEDQE